MRAFRVLVHLAAVLAVGAAPTTAQTPSPPAPSEDRATSVGTFALAGIGLGIGGFATGALIGAGLASDCTSHEYCGLEGAFYGAAAGGTFGMALGMHLANKRRGNLALGFLAGALVWGAGISLAAASDWDDQVAPIVFVAIPIVQLVVTAGVEQATGRVRPRSDGVTLAIAPARDGLRLLGRVAW